VVVFVCCWCPLRRVSNRLTRLRLRNTQRCHSAGPIALPRGSPHRAEFAGASLRARKGRPPPSGSPPPLFPCLRT
jgi:hypothetical protein